MDWLDLNALGSAAGIVESGVVYGASLFAAIYLVRTMYRIFVPKRRRGATAPACAGCSKGCQVSTPQQP